MQIIVAGKRGVDSWLLLARFQGHAGLNRFGHYSIRCVLRDTDYLPYYSVASITSQNFYVEPANNRHGNRNNFCTKRQGFRCTVERC